MSVSSASIDKQLDNNTNQKSDYSVTAGSIKKTDVKKDELFQPASIYPDITREKWFWDKAVIS
jgi:hypothetical protein